MRFIRKKQMDTLTIQILKMFMPAPMTWYLMAPANSASVRHAMCWPKPYLADTTWDIDPIVRGIWASFN